METSSQSALHAAIVRLLRPLVRILLRNGIPFGVMADLVKQVYVEVASQELRLPGRKQTTSRVSILTGLTRKEVARIKQMPAQQDQEAIQRYHRAARVVSGWVRESEFHTPEGEPAALPMEGERGSFLALVKRFSGDMPARAVLDELLRVGAMERLADGRMRLLMRSYVPQASDIDKLAILGTDVAALISTIDWNLGHPPTEAYFQRKVQYDNLPAEALPELRSLTQQQAQELLERLDGWMARHDRDVNRTVEGTGRKQAMVGIYYFEEDFLENR